MLVRDGGTLQLGIGAHSDAVVHGLLPRHDENDVYRDALRRMGAVEGLRGNPSPPSPTSRRHYARPPPPSPTSYA